ncbi:hypothetical protein ACRASX_02360 [Flavobacterium sp. TMP13]|uniref:hypothetical protein n=1 Tax=Flavobacterium sp. TMP13 TaxID=3425950 RepID=UPI003D787C2B
MKKQIITIVAAVLLCTTVQSCKKSADRPDGLELTPGQKLDTLLEDMNEKSDTASVKIDSTIENIKRATKKGAKAVEGAAKDVKEGVEKTADNVSKEMKK